MSSIGSGRLRPRRAKERFHILEKELATTTLGCIGGPQAQDKFYARVLHSASHGPLPASCFDPEKGASRFCEPTLKHILAKQAASPSENVTE
jgi:hypothetical protein